MKKKLNNGFRHIFTVAFLPFLAPVGAVTLGQFPKYAGYSLTFT